MSSTRKRTSRRAGSSNRVRGLEGLGFRVSGLGFRDVGLEGFRDLGILGFRDFRVAQWYPFSLSLVQGSLIK